MWNDSSISVDILQLLVVLAVLAVASAQYVSSGYAYPYTYNGLYRSAAYTGYAAPYAYRSGYYGGLGSYYYWVKY